jgi:hypothetical protein
VLALLWLEPDEMSYYHLEKIKNWNFKNWNYAEEKHCYDTVAAGEA